MINDDVDDGADGRKEDSRPGEPEKSVLSR